jgi:hypothetical protein
MKTISPPLPASLVAMIVMRVVSAANPPPRRIEENPEFARAGTGAVEVPVKAHCPGHGRNTNLATIA